MHATTPIHTATSNKIRQFVTVAATAARRRGERGQSTAEYALLLLGAATIALIVVTWATGTGKISELFDAVVDSIIGRV